MNEGVVKRNVEINNEVDNNDLSIDQVLTAIVDKFEKQELKYKEQEQKYMEQSNRINELLAEINTLKNSNETNSKVEEPVEPVKVEEKELSPAEKLRIVYEKLGLNK